MRAVQPITVLAAVLSVPFIGIGLAWLVHTTNEPGIKTIEVKVHHPPHPIPTVQRTQDAY